MKILTISDTHSFHNELTIPSDIDMILFGGDESNSSSPIMNHEECIDFLNWFEIQNIKYKVMIAGNHSTAIYQKMITKADIEARGIIYLEHESINIEGINIFGSPYTPTFGNWSFMIGRHKLDEYWKEIPDNTDIILTHGPPKGILDLTRNRDGSLEFCGDQSLLNHVYRIQPKYTVFGHIHNCVDCVNKGIRNIPELPTTFINASCVTDGKFRDGLTSKGIVFEY
jgi:Icc-related predicted phosphoesterase